MNNRIKQAISDSVEVKNAILSSDKLLKTIQSVADEMTRCFKNDGKVLFCGNGGSAADAQHLAAEFSGRFYYDRPPLYSEALHVNSSFVTAVGNDYSYDEVYARMIKAMGKRGDVLVAISTSGNSGNILRAIETAKQKGMIVVGMTGRTGGLMEEKCTYLLNMPSTDTPRVQESHIMVGHILCELVEAAVFPK
ncbi:MAG: D-sedoheptulose 7-phosphate isomerase [Bacteroidetes bacterium]|nr:D-sedoheptulose 7-phosphate isomerase [Bacteroidota bacterium]